MNNKAKIIEVIKWILAIILVVGFAVIGSICNINGWYDLTVCVIMLCVLSVGLILWTIISCIKKKKFMDNVDRENLQKNLLEQRERAEEIAKEMIASLKKMIGTMDLISLAVLICVLAITFCFFALVGAEAGGAALPMVLGAYTGLGFIRSRSISVNEKKSDDYLPEDDYPLIYKNAMRARDVVGCNGKIKIFIDHNFNASILEIADGYSVRLGSYILDNVSEGELYNILLHEFAHVTKKNDDINRIMNYANYTLDISGAVGFSVLPCIYIHTKFFFDYVSYQYICSIMNEDTADRAMRNHGDPKVAASMIIKLKFSELYQWERKTYDEENLFESEKIIDDCVKRTLDAYKERMAVRKEQWMKMIDGEIISRNATHPTAKMRIENLGVKELSLVPKEDSPEYLAEVDRAILQLEKYVRADLEPRYETIRKENYAAPNELIEKWEKEGKPLTNENYQDLIVAFFTANRISEFVNLCCQIIEEIPEPANYFAHHMYGCYLLHSYDERGIEHLYKSVELNHNNWEEALQTIGEYACTVGKQDELDKYRARVEGMVKKQIDVYEKMDSLQVKDKLVEEKLPEGELSGFLSYVESIDNGVIDGIYMVRKVIDEEHFVTCVVVSPKRKADPESFGEVMGKIFQYLDKSSQWQYSLFDMRFSPRARILKVKNSLVYKGKTRVL